MYNPKPSHLRAALVALIVAMLAACLWPFNFRPSNQVHWLDGEPGVRFSGMGQIVSREAFPPLSQLSADGSMTVEVVVRPMGHATCRVPHILSFNPDEGPTPLVIGAWRNSVLVRLGRAGGGGRSRYREIGARDAFTADRASVVITVVTGPTGTDLYVNGHLERAAPEAVIEGAGPVLGRLLLGISGTALGEWHGDVLGLKLYNRALSADEVLAGAEARQRKAGEGVSADALRASYAFAEGSGHVVHDSTGRSPDLLIEEVFRPLRRVFLTFGEGGLHLNRSTAGDAVLNVLGFMPYAFLMAWYLSTRTGWTDRRAATAVVLSAFLLSLSIELAQGFLPTRSSSLIDLFTNTAGAAIGVLAFAARSSKSSSAPAPEGTAGGTPQTSRT